MVDKNENGHEEITDIEIPDDGAADGSDANGASGADGDGSGQPEKPTLSELAEAGLSKPEIELAQKQGLVQGESDGDKGDGGDGDTHKGVVDKSTDGSTKKEGESNGKKEKETEERNRVLVKGKSPEQIISEVGEKGALTPDQEQVLIASLSQNGQAMYWAQKKERQKRQRIEGEFGDFKTKTQKELDDLRSTVAKLSTKKTEEDPLNIDGEGEEEVDPNNKPLTKADLDKIEADKKTKADEEAAKENDRRVVVSDALNFQQEEAKERYGAEEFDTALKSTAEILQHANAGTLATLYPEPRQRSRITRKVVDLLKAFANADAFEDGDFNAADMTYELAKENPKYKPASKSSKSNANGNKNGETGADGNPEDVDRALKNANRRGSSATLNGGSSRRVTLDELTPENAVKIPLKNWNKLPKEKREELLRS